MPTTVTATRKPAQVVAPAEATVEAFAATYDEVLDAGLAALRETNVRLFAYGICGVRRPTSAAVILSGTFTVYADRD